MARAPRYVCQSCGASHTKWSGRCEACDAWNAIVEEAATEAPPKGLKGGKGRVIELAALKVAAQHVAGAQLADAEVLAGQVAEIRTECGQLLPAYLHSSAPLRQT